MARKRRKTSTAPPRTAVAAATPRAKPAPLPHDPDDLFDFADGSDPRAAARGARCLAHDRRHLRQRGDVRRRPGRAAAGLRDRPRLRRRRAPPETERAPSASGAARCRARAPGFAPCSAAACAAARGPRSSRLDEPQDRHLERQQHPLAAPEDPGLDPRGQARHRVHAGAQDRGGRFPARAVQGRRLRGRHLRPEDLERRGHRVSAADHRRHARAPRRRRRRPSRASSRARSRACAS